MEIKIDNNLQILTIPWIIHLNQDWGEKGRRSCLESIRADSSDQGQFKPGLKPGCKNLAIGEFLDILGCNRYQWATKSGNTESIDVFSTYNQSINTSCCKVYT